jgi:hypothetical protein
MKMSPETVLVRKEFGRAVFNVAVFASSIPHRHPSNNGKQIWFGSLTGNPVGFFKYCIDITARSTAASRSSRFRCASGSLRLIARSTATRQSFIVDENGSFRRGAISTNLEKFDNFFQSISD